MRFSLPAFLPQKKERRLGIDIGTNSIKLVELSRSQDRVKLETYGTLANYAALERLGDAFQTKNLELFDKEVGGLTRELVKMSGVKTDEAVMSVPLYSSFVTPMEFPEMPREEIAQAIPLEARGYLPVPVADVILDWEPIGRLGGKQFVLLVAVPKETIAKYQRIAAAAALTLKALEVETIALSRALLRSSSESTLLIDIGSRVTSLAVVQGKASLVSYAVDTAGEDLSQAISRGLQVGLSRADELKRELDLRAPSGTQAEHLAKLVTPFLDTIVREAERLLVSSARFPQAPAVSRVVLSGGSSHLKGLDGYIGDRLKLPVEIGRPFAGIDYPVVLNELLEERGPALAVSVGLALRNLLE